MHLKTKIKLKDIKVKNNSGKNFVDIKNHDYYKALKYNSKHIYLQSVKKSYVQLQKKTADWNEFLKLLDDIKKNGFNVFKDSVIIKNKYIPEDNENLYICLHGRHRICMIRYLYGKKCKVLVNENDKVIKVYK